MLVSLDGVSKSFGAERIFSGVTCRIEDRDRIGLVGINGAGKTTLLNLIAGASECDGGSLSFGSGFSLGYLRQNAGLQRGNTVLSEMRGVFADVYRAQEEMRALGERMAAAPEGAERHALADAYKAAEDRVLSRDGYNVEVKIRTVLNGMGFAGQDDAVIDTLSGGEQTRLAIAKLLLEQPALLILDEPTNHLDFQTLGWLEGYLSGWRGALLIVSHDRYFLDRVCTKIWEMENGELTVYGGNYTRYLALRGEQDDRRRKLYEAQKAEITKMEDYVAKNLVRASTTKMAQGRRKAAEKAKAQLVTPRRSLKPPHIRLRYTMEPVSEVLKARALEVTAGEGPGAKTLISDAEFVVRRGERVAIIGANGAGKTTLLRCLIGEQRPAAGRIDWGGGVRWAYYSQGSDNLDPDKTVLQTVWDAYPADSETELRSMLGAMGLTGDDAFKRVDMLSGGERARLKLAAICLGDSNVLILDEPTNHLDLETKEVLEDALLGYPGTLLMVSHDRYLLDRIPNRIFAIEDGRLNLYRGGWTQYQAIRDARGEAERAEKAETRQQTRELSANAEKHYRSKQDRQAEAKRRRDYADAEKNIAALEEELDWLHNAIDDASRPGGDYQKLQQLCADADEAEKQLSEAMDLWAALGDRIEAAREGETP